MLSIEIKHYLPREVAFPVHLDEHVIFPWLQFDLYRRVVVTVKNVVDVFIQLLCAFFDF